MNKLEEIKAKIESNKEILETLPKNNKKNINIYINKLEELKEEFVNNENQILKEIEKRYNKIKDIQEASKIDSMEQELNNSEGVLYLLNKVDTSYEKMDLDKAIQNLSYYYKKNLEIINENIVYVIKKFKEVGIELKEEDFCYSNYVREYINVFLWELKSEDTNSKRIKSKFEEIYWKCPEIITHIQLNIRYLYLKNEKTIDKYYLKQKETLLRNFTAEDLINRYTELKTQLLEETKNNKGILINAFITGQLDPKEFTESAIQSNYSKFISEENLKNINDTKLKEIDINLIKLLNSIYEYKNYLKYKFIIDDIKKIYEDKAKYKNIYNETRKAITKKEQKLMKINNKIDGKGLFKKQSDNYITEQNNLILEIKQLYKELDKNKICNKVYTDLNDSSTLIDVLEFASSFYKYLFDCMKEKYKDMLEEEIQENIEELREFIKWPYVTILNNIGILDSKDILLIIKDRYHLLNINITKEDLDLDNLENLSNLIKNIEINHNIKNNDINVEEMKCMCEFKKILKK